jgi:hypothetical protein
MTHALLKCAAAGLMAGMASFAMGQTGGTGSPGASPGGTSASGSSVRSASPSDGGGAAEPQLVEPSVPQPATNPNAQVPPSAAGLPGGGGQVPLTPGSGVDTAVPIYGARDASSPSVANSINESEERSSNTDCGGTGTRSSTGSGSTSATTTACANRGLGTPSIMGTSGPINVTGR